MSFATLFIRDFSFESVLFFVQLGFKSPEYFERFEPAIHAQRRSGKLIREANNP